MALEEFLKSVDDSLEKVFNEKIIDPSKKRKQLIAFLDKISNQFAEGKSKGTGWQIRNGVVKLTVRLSGIPLNIGAQEVFLIPEDRFTDAITNLKIATEKGELDSAIDAAKNAPKATTTKRKITARSAERRAKFDAQKGSK